MSLYLGGIGHFKSIEDLLDLLAEGGYINQGFTLMSSVIYTVNILYFSAFYSLLLRFSQVISQNNKKTQAQNRKAENLRQHMGFIQGVYASPSHRC